MGKRRVAREYCIQTLYLMDIGSLSPDEAAATVREQSDDMDAETDGFALSLVNGAATNLPSIDQTIQEYAKNWRIGRMSIVDKCILRMSTYELLFCADTPAPSIIDEAIELAKKYSTENSGRFINGVLDRIKEKRGAPPAKAQ